MNGLVYHGSAEKLERIQPRKNVRMGNGNVIWNAESFHATPYRWIALAYMRDKSAVETTGVDLYQLQYQVEIIGPGTIENALTSLYGKGGYLYEFSANDFQHAEGLGTLEVYSTKDVVPLRVTRIDDPVAEMRKESVEFVFTQKDDPKAS